MIYSNWLTYILDIIQKLNMWWENMKVPKDDSEMKRKMGGESIIHPPIVQNRGRVIGESVNEKGVINLPLKQPMMESL